VQEQRKYLTVKQVSHYLQIKPSTIDAWVVQGRIPSVKIHGVVRFQQEEIDRWVESFRKDETKTLPAKIFPVDFRAEDQKDIDLLIAKAKREVYNPRRGETRPISSPRKEGKNGAV
jgi:excisionase family DNA binding protein